MATPPDSTNTTTATINSSGSNKNNLKKKAPVRGKGSMPSKIKMTKEERRSKYTQIARDRKAKVVTRHRESQLTCYNCRKTGHSVHNCPDDASNNNSKKNKGGKNNDSTETGGRICYACGSTEHGLAKCPNKNKNSKNDELPFATCFVCQGKGHLASQCPKNEKGVYVNGGACKYCQSVRHLATACPTKEKPDKALEREAKAVPDVNVQDLLEGDGSDHDGKDNIKNRGDETGGADKANADATAKQKKPKRRVVNF
jgi:zinc finger CCHC domain-containing protein 9